MKIKKILIIVAASLAIIIALGYGSLKYLEYKITNKISHAELVNTNFNYTLPFEYVNNWILVRAILQGSSKNVPFFFDTGAQTVILDTLLNEIGEKNYETILSNSKTNNPGTAFNNEILSIKEIRIGELCFKDVGALSARNSSWEMLNCVSPFGIIGCNMIENHYTHINYETKQLRITDDIKNIPSPEQYRWINFEPLKTQNSPLITAQINDSISIKLLFDTGNSGGVLIRSKKLYNSLKNTKSNRITKIYKTHGLKIRGESNDIFCALKYIAPKFSIGGFSATNFPIIIEDSDQEEKEYYGLIGNKYLEHFLVTLDFKEQRIGLIQKMEIKPAPASFGIGIKAEENKLVVSSIREELYSKGSGIIPGNEIISINGVKTSDLTKTDYCAIYTGRHELIKPTDTVLDIQIKTNSKVMSYKLKR